MKKFLLCLLSLCMSGSLLFQSTIVYASEEVQTELADLEKIYDEELNNAIISGDGSAEHPYIVDYDKAPNFKEYIESVGNEALHALSGGNNAISTFGIFDGALSGKTHTNQTRGGYWNFQSGQPSAVSDGKLWMQKVEYISISQTKAIRDLLEDEIYNTVKNKIQDILKKPFTDAVKEMVNLGIEKLTSEAFLQAIGWRSKICSLAQAIGFLDKCFTLNKYNNAVSNGYGMINAVYSSSYHGSWYQYNGEDTWTSAPTAYEPGSAYGVGTYASY